jgi:hypothetical protein
MNLDEAQKQKVAAWIEEGFKLSEIQSKLASEFGVQMTYMEVRFLMDDLKLRPKEKERSAPATGLVKGGLQQGTPAGAEPLEEGPAFGKETGSAGGPSVSVDQVTRPGALVSGKVSFRDGNSAEWSLDQFGRLAFMPKKPATMLMGRASTVTMVSTKRLRLFCSLRRAASSS